MIGIMLFVGILLPSFVIAVLPLDESAIWCLVLVDGCFVASCEHFQV
jgi:hypothetical protein